MISPGHVAIDLCAVCEHPLQGPVKVTLENSRVRLVQCGKCGSWIYLPRRDSQAQAALHDEAEYYTHPYFQERRSDLQAADSRCREIFTRVSYGVNLASLRGQCVLDVGCDTGTFIASAARQFGIVPTGIDVSGQAVRVAKSHGVDAYCCDLVNAPAHLRELPLITVIDLIEHLIDPVCFLEQARSRLRPRGLLYMETPNPASTIYGLGSFLSRLSNGRPAALLERLFPPHHVEYFTASSLSDLARRQGLDLAWIGSRVLPPRDLAVSLPLRVGITALQGLDVMLNRRILLCALLRKTA